MSFKEWKETDLVTIPSHWNIRQLSECIHTVIDYRGKTPKKLGGDWSVTPTNYRALSAKNIKSGVIVREETIRYLDEELYFKWMKEEIQKDDILMTSEAPLGELLFWNSDEKIVLSQRLYGVRPNVNIVYPRYLYLYMSSNVYQNELDSRASGTTVTGIRQTELLKTRVILPPLNEQKAIADILSSLDEKIELNNQMNEALEEMAQALFKRWFVDFEFPNEEGQPYRSSGGEMVESELGMIPEGWEVRSLDSSIIFQNGYAFKSKDLLDKPQENCYHVFKMGHIVKGGGLNKLGTKSYICKSDCDNLEKFVLKKGDLLMCMTDMKNNVALLGHTALMDEDNKYILNQRVGLIRSKSPELLNYPYLYMLTNSKIFIDNLRSRANSGVQVNLSTKEIKESLFVCPNKLIHEKFNNLVEVMFEKKILDWI